MAGPWERDWGGATTAVEPGPAEPGPAAAGGGAPWERDWQAAPAAQTTAEPRGPWERDWNGGQPGLKPADNTGDGGAPIDSGRREVYVRPARPGDAMDAEAERRTREALEAGDVRKAQEWARMRAARDTGERDLNTAQVQEAAIRAPYLVVRGAASGITLGLSEPVLAALEREMGGRVQAETTVEALGEGAAKLLGGVFTGQGVARGMHSLTGRLGLVGAKQVIATRLAAAGVHAALNSLGSMAAGDATAGTAAGNVAQSMGASLVGILPEAFLPRGVGNFVGQVLTDFGYDLATDALLRDRLKDRRFVDWLVTDELPQLVMSVAFATRDLTDKNFEASRKVMRYQLGNMVRTRLEAPKLRARGVPEEVIARAANAVSADERAYVLDKWTREAAAPRTAPVAAVPQNLQRAAGAPSADELRKRVADGNLRRELEGLAGELEGLQVRAKGGEAGLAPIRDERGTLLGWQNQGAVYPDGMDGDTASLIRRHLAGEDLTDGQRQRVAAAVTYAAERVSRAAGFDVERQEQVDQPALKVGDRMKIDGEEFRVTAEDEDGRLTLKDGVERTLTPEQAVTLDKGTWRGAGGAPVDAAARTTTGEDAFDAQPARPAEPDDTAKAADNEPPPKPPEATAAGEPKMRGTPERIAATPGNQKLKLEERPGSYYDPLSIRAREEAQARMTDAELLEQANRGDNPYAGLDRVAYWNRLHEQWVAAKRSGNAQAAEDLARRLGEVSDSMAARATEAAQYMRFLQELRTATPAGAVSFVERALQRAGRQLTDAQRTRLERLAEADQTARRALQDAERAAVDGPADPVKLKAYGDALSAAQKAHQRFAEQVVAWTPKTWPDLIRTLRAGNLLRGTTHIINTTSNMIMGTITDAAQDLVAAGNLLLRYASGRRIPQAVAFVNPMARASGAARGLVRGVREAFTGARPDFARSGEVTEFDERSLHPIRAIMHALGRGPGLLASAETGRVPVGDRLKKLVEAFGGAYPELTFRLLRAEDLVFRESRYQAKLDELGRARGLRGEELRRFRTLPPSEARDAAMSAALDDVFQGGSGQKVNRWFTGALRKTRLGDWFDALALHAVKPYTTTPVNVFVTAVKLSNPGVAMGVGAGHIVQARRLTAQAIAAEKAGNTAEAVRLRSQARRAMEKGLVEGVGYAVIGATMNLAAAALYNAGILQPPADRDAKLRELERRTGEPGRINRSALGRLLRSPVTGEDPAPRPGDVWMDLWPLGFFGLNAAIVSRRMRDQENSGIDPNQRAALERAWDGLAGATVAMANGTLQFPMLQGTWELLRGIYQGDERGVIRMLWRGATGTAMPGVIEQYSRSRQDVLPDMYARSNLESLRNAVMESNPLIDWQSAFPARRTPLGDTVERTPAGVPRFLYHMLDASKAAPAGPVDPVWAEVSRVWAASRMRGAIPGYPDRSFSTQIQDGPQRGRTVQVEVTPFEYSEYLEMVGARRRQAFESVVQSRAYKRGTPVDQARWLERAWSQGVDLAHREWYMKQREGATQFMQRVRDTVQQHGGRKTL